MMLVTGQGPQCTWALGGVRAGHLAQAVPLTWSLDTLGSQVAGHSSSPKAASILSVLHIGDIGVLNKTVFKKWSPRYKRSWKSLAGVKADSEKWGCPEENW